jgi:hypothetical protein
MSVTGATRTRPSSFCTIGMKRLAREGRANSVIGGRRQRGACARARRITSKLGLLPACIIQEMDIKSVQSVGFLLSHVSRSLDLARNRRVTHQGGGRAHSGPSSNSKADASACPWLKQNIALPQYAQRARANATVRRQDGGCGGACEKRG